MTPVRVILILCLMFWTTNLFSLTERDSVELKKLHNKCWEVIYSDLDSAMYYAEQGLEKVKGKNTPFFEASFHNVIASVYSIKGDLVKSIEGYRLAYDIAGRGGDIKGQAFYANNLGNVFYSLDDTSSALKYYLEALDLHTKAENNYGLGLAYSNLSVLHEEMKLYEKAFEYQFQAIPLKVIHDSSGLGESYFNLAMLYMDLYLLSDDSLKMYSNKLWNIQDIGAWRISLLDSMDIYLSRSLALHELNQHDFGMGITLKGMADVAFHRKDFKKAMDLFQRSFEIAESMDAVEEKRDVAYGLYKVYKQLGDIKNALKWHENYITFYKAIASDDMLKEVTRKEISFQYEKKSFEDSVAYSQKEQRDRLVIAEKDARLNQERTMRIAFIIGLLLFIALSVVMYRNYRIKKKDNKIISEQKRETEEKKLIIEEKQKEILDSINYAKRLQQAILATPDEITHFLKENFLLYVPKDIVAGDFYFFEVTEKHIFYAAADCTGHGVPGALVSIVCSNALSRSVKEFQLEIPGNILDKTRELVVQTFEKSGKDVKDGMDISFLAIDRKTNQVSWAGANNPLWYLQNGIIKEITATKQPIGKTDQPVSFDTHYLNVPGSEIDTVYLFTDGFADQFGGPKGKKYKYATLKEFLLRQSTRSLADQKKLLEEELNRWMHWPDSNGVVSAVEQLDDICVIGIKLNGNA